MKTMKRIPLLCAAAGLCAAAAAGAATTGTSVAGHPYVSGGVGNSEQQALRADRGRYSLWAVTAARGSGAYLADVRVRVTDQRRRTVFDRALDGPWLMIDLPRGRYTVEATHDGQTVRRTASIGAGGTQRMVLYFNVPGADVRAGQATPDARVAGGARAGARAQRAMWRPDAPSRRRQPAPRHPGTPGAANHVR